jgi:hypothetical protein
MRYKLLALLACGAFFAAIAAAAQDRDWDRDHGPGVVDRVLSDIDRSSYDRYVDRHERKEFESARHDLIRFQDNWRRGKFDTDRLDGAIDHIHHIVDSGRVEPRMAGLLARDMEALRDFRASGGRYRYHDREYSYRDNDDRRW